MQAVTQAAQKPLKQWLKARNALSHVLCNMCDVMCVNRQQTNEEINKTTKYIAISALTCMKVLSRLEKAS